MSLLVHFSGPSFSQTAVLQPGAPAIVVGRDPQAGVYLPDTERVISRQHLSMQWNEGGVRVDVLSRVNSLVTGRGEITSGQHVVLGTGEAAQLGHYSFTVARSAAAPIAAPSPAALPADDPFAVFASASSPSGGSPTTVFDDPFFQPAAAPSAPLMDTPAALAAMSNGSQRASTFSGSSSGISDPLAAFGGPAAPANPAGLIDEFLGAPGTTGSGLGSSSLLRPAPLEQAPRLAIDHVHDFNLPVSPNILQTAPPPAAAAMDVDPLAALAASQAPQPGPAAARDPWADLPSEWMSPPATPTPEIRPSPAIEHPHPTPAAAPPIHDDPFSSSTSWRVDLGDGSIDPFSHSFVGDPSSDAFAAPAPVRAEAAAPAAAPGRAGPAADEALAALCRGLGLGASAPQQLSAREWEQMGTSVRMIVQGLTELMNVRAELKKELRAVDRTMLGAQENNPLKTGMELDELLHYLLFMPAGAAGYMPVKAALEEAIGDLRGHEFASVSAVRAAVEGSIREFDPQKLRPALLKGKKSIALVDNARLWDLYATFYEKKREHLADWLEQMFNRHFMPTYSRETERLRRERVQVQPRRH